MNRQIDPIAQDIASIRSLAEIPLMLEVCARSANLGFAAVARVTEQRWVTCASLDKGGFNLLPGDEVPVERTICRDVYACREAVVLDDIRHHPTYRDHAATESFGIGSFISMPIIHDDGRFFGTLCACDAEPRRLNTPETIGMFRLFADMIALLLDRQTMMERNYSDLADERETARLREEFIAVVGHDLRNPLAALNAGMRVVEREPTTPTQAKTIGHMREAVRRMGTIVDNLLDFARGRLGSGLVIEVSDAVDLDATMELVSEEIRVANDCDIQADFQIGRPVQCDRQRMEQLLSNLLSNAVTYGKPDGPVRVAAWCEGADLRLTVRNNGTPIPPDALPTLFLPFTRGGQKPSRQGLGLGLYIASEIARAHGGALTVQSDEAETKFDLRMPLERRS
jgi:signal transduction histidine kinase